MEPYIEIYRVGAVDGASNRIDYDGIPFYVFICIYTTLFIPFALRNDCNHTVLLPDKLNVTGRIAMALFLLNLCVCSIENNVSLFYSRVLSVITVIY